MGEMAGLPEKQENLLRWLLMDVKTKSNPVESSTKKVKCFNGHEAISSLLQSCSPSIKKQIKNDSQALEFMRMLVKDKIVVRAEKVYNDEKKYCVRQHKQQVFNKTDKFFWGIDSGINFTFITNVVGFLSLVISIIYWFVKRNELNEDAENENDWNTNDEFWSGST